MPPSSELPAASSRLQKGLATARCYGGICKMETWGTGSRQHCLSAHSCVVVRSPGSPFKPLWGDFLFLSAMGHSAVPPAAAGRAGGGQPEGPWSEAPGRGALFTLLCLCCHRQMPLSCHQWPWNAGSHFLGTPHLRATPSVPQLPGKEYNNRCKINAFSFFYSVVATSFSPLWLQGDWAAGPELTALLFGTLCCSPTVKGLFALRKHVLSSWRNV